VSHAEQQEQRAQMPRRQEPLLTAEELAGKAQKDTKSRVCAEVPSRDLKLTFIQEPP
jgi:hypothetical protein